MTAHEKRGFAALSPEQRREMASAGGKAAQASGRGHRFTVEEARAAGQKGGAVIASRPGHMTEIGRKGGASLSSDREHMAEIGRIGGAVTSAKPGHMIEIAHRGGAATRALHAQTEPEAS